MFLGFFIFLRVSRAKVSLRVHIHIKNKTNMAMLIKKYLLFPFPGRFLSPKPSLVVLIVTLVCRFPSLGHLMSVDSLAC